MQLQHVVAGYEDKARRQEQIERCGTHGSMPAMPMAGKVAVLTSRIICIVPFNPFLCPAEKHGSRQVWLIDPFWPRHFPSWFVSTWRGKKRRWSASVPRCSMHGVCRTKGGVCFLLEAPLAYISETDAEVPTAEASEMRNTPYTIFLRLTSLTLQWSSSLMSPTYHVGAVLLILRPHVPMPLPAPLLTWAQGAASSTASRHAQGSSFGRRPRGAAASSGRNE